MIDHPSTMAASNPFDTAILILFLFSIYLVWLLVRRS